MSKGPENRFIDSIHRILKGKLHFEKMHNIYRGGTADVWYSGDLADLWIEYKWLPRVPKRGVVKPKLKPLQREWLQGRYDEGRSVCVAIGCPAGAIWMMTPEEWDIGVSASSIKIMPKKELAEEILLFCGTSETTNAKSSKGSTRSTTDRNIRVQNRGNSIPAVRISKVSTKEKKCVSSRRITKPH